MHVLMYPNMLEDMLLPGCVKHTVYLAGPNPKPRIVSDGNGDEYLEEEEWRYDIADFLGDRQDIVFVDPSRLDMKGLGHKDALRLDQWELDHILESDVVVFWFDAHAPDLELYQAYLRLKQLVLAAQMEAGTGVTVFPPNRVPKILVGVDSNADDARGSVYRLVKELDRKVVFADGSEAFLYHINDDLEGLAAAANFHTTDHKAPAPVEPEVKHEEELGPPQWNCVQFVGTVGTEFAIVGNSMGRLVVTSRRPGEEWPHGIQPVGGNNTLVAGATSYVVYEQKAIHKPKEFETISLSTEEVS